MQITIKLPDDIANQLQPSNLPPNFGTHCSRQLSPRTHWSRPSPPNDQVKGYHSQAPNSLRLLRNTEVICSRRFSKLAAMPIKIMPAIRPTTHLMKG